MKKKHHNSHYAKHIVQKDIKKHVDESMWQCTSAMLDNPDNNPSEGGKLVTQNPNWNPNERASARRGTTRISS